MTDFITVQEAEDEELIPESFTPYIPTKCCYCNKDMYINANRTIMKCLNPNCIRKVAYQADALLKDLGFKGYGPEKLTAYCEETGIDSILLFIRFPPEDFNLVDELNAMQLTFPKLVEMLHIPNFGSKAYKVFDGFNSYEEFLADLTAKEDPAQYLVNRVGGQETTLAVTQIMSEYDDVLRHITDYIVTKKQAARVVLLQITGHILNVTDDGSPLTKDAYVKILNDEAASKGIEFRRSDALKSVSFIVADSKSNTRKYRIGAERGVLVTSDQLLLAIKGMK